MIWKVTYSVPSGEEYYICYPYLDNNGNVTDPHQLWHDEFKAAGIKTDTYIGAELVNNHPAKDINISNMKKKIKFTWEERSSFDTERVGAMYCFKRCDVNQN